MGVSPERAKVIQDAVDALLREVWQRRRGVYARKSVPRAESVPIPPGRVVEVVLRMGYEEPDEIPPDLREDIPPRQCAGVLDRPGNRVLVAQKWFRPESRRFTCAHEIGHVLLHPGLRLHRDRPPPGVEHELRKRPPQEVEADVFAAKLLMPERILTDSFMARFGAKIGAATDLDLLAFWFTMSIGAGRRINTLMLREELRYKTRLVADCTQFGAEGFPSLAAMFGVSSETMAIRLEELGLVT